MTFARSWMTRAGETTTWRSEWGASGNGIPSPRGGSIRTRWPTPLPALLNQLFGKGKEPFWQQAYTNLVRWIIELHRVLPEQWVTLQQVYQCAIDPDLFAAKIKQAEAWSAELNTGEVFVKTKIWRPKIVDLGEWTWTPIPETEESRAKWSPELEHKLEELGIQAPDCLGARSR